MTFSLEDFHRRHRSLVIRDWVDRLKTEVGEQYAQRSRAELMDTVSGAFDANYHVLVRQEYSHINRFIDKITRMRLETGFLLSDVQKAFELYRIIIIPILANETTTEEFKDSITRINSLLAYTMHRFSDHFQDMHEEKILEHNKKLEEDVRERTADLRESEMKYKILVEEITDGYFVVQNEKIVFANKAFCTMHGYKMDKVLDSRFYKFIDPCNREKVMKIYNRSYVGRRKPKSFEYLRKHRDGRSFPTEILAKNTMYENKLSSIGICRDITERKKMENRVREAEKMAYIGQITTSLSHEIRNPLSAVKMNLQILNKNENLKGNDQRRIDISVREVIRLERILKEILDFAKPIQIKFGDFQINRIIISCLELLEMKFKEKGLSIVLLLDSQMPDISSDSEKLGQTFINLLLNAIEASYHNRIITVESKYQPNGGNPVAEVIINDEGHGVKDVYIEEIFKPFFTTKTKGTGLGLTNVRRIIEAHNGWIEVKSRTSGGASFKISLPAGKNHG